jgi:nucleotide-binding universal stress UspA family protein
MAVQEAVTRMQERIAEAAGRVLAERWPEVRATLVNRAPSDAILAEARRLGASVVVMGSRGHTGLSRLWLGSVSREVVRRAPCAVLVVKGKLEAAPRIVAGLDGSPNARRAVRFLAALQAPPRGEIRLVRVVEPVRAPSVTALPTMTRRVLAGEAAAVEAQRRAAASKELDSARSELARAGWRVRVQVRTGVPLAELLGAAREAHADLVAIGARGVGGIERLLLGSVAEGILTRSPVSVLVVR